MRAATLLLTTLALAPSLTLAAPINPAHYEELEARWNPFHMSSQQKQNVKDFGKGFAQGFGSVMKKAAPVALSIAPMIIKREEEEMALLKREEEQHLERRLSQKAKNFWNKVGQGVKKAAPVALSLAPLVLKREEEMMELLKREEEQHLERRISQKAKNFWNKVGHGAEKAWDVLGPTAAQLTAKHYGLVGRDVDEHLAARALEFADAEEALHKRDEMPVELFERDFSPIGLEELERRGISQGAKNFWSKVGHGAEHVFEQLGPLALQVGAHAVEGRRAHA